MMRSTRSTRLHGNRVGVVEVHEVGGKRVVRDLGVEKNTVGVVDANEIVSLVV